MGEPAYRAAQLNEWLWKKSARSFEEMTNLSKKIRDRLNNRYVIRPVKVRSSQRSADRTIKSTFLTHDHQVVEGVLIPTSTRMTACISSQVGCSLACSFCATGKLPKVRNLEASEIYDQVVVLKEMALNEYDIPLSNIVYMGMGEPLLNYREVMKSITYLTSGGGLGISPKRITVSTAGIAKMIHKLGDDGARFNLALSLHAANDQKRSQIMEINNTNALSELREALHYFYSQTRSKITFEYVLLDGFNNSIKDAEELFLFTRQFPSKVNIIEYNQVKDVPFRTASAGSIDQFAGYLHAKGVQVSVRRSRGKDIDAACGQLAGKQQVSSST